MGNGRWLGLWMLVGTWLSAAELEVRCYRVGWFHLERALWVPEEIDDPFSADDEDLVEDEPVWQGIEEAGFESRFLEGHGELRDYRPLLVKWFGGEFDGQAVYDMNQKHLVVRAAAAELEELAKDLRNGIPTQVKVQVSLFKMPYESAQDVGTFWGEAPPEATELVSLASLSVPGETAVAGTPGEELFFESECQVSRNDESFELRLTARSRKKGQSFLVKSGYTIPMGVTWVEKVGSVDGEKSLVMTITPDLLLSSGVRVDEWILKENGGAFLCEERLRRFPRREEETVERLLGEDTVLREFWIPAHFMFFLHTPPGNGAEVDAFASDDYRSAWASRWPPYQGEAPELRRWRGMGLRDLRELLAENGVEFRESDFAVVLPHRSTLIAKNDPANMALIEAIVEGCVPPPPRLICLELTQWAGGQAGQASGERVMRSIGGSVIPGETMTVHSGEDLALEVDGQIDQNDQLIQLRATLSGKGRKMKRPSFKNGMTVESGQPLVVQESRVGGKRRAWVLTARVIEIGRELDRFLERSGR